MILDYLEHISNITRKMLYFKNSWFLYLWIIRIWYLYFQTQTDKRCLILMHSCVIVIKNYVICLYTKEIKLLKTGCFINPNLISKQISYFNLEIKVWYVIKHKTPKINRQRCVGMILKIMIYWLDLLELYIIMTLNMKKNMKFRWVRWTLNVRWYYTVYKLK